MSYWHKTYIYHYSNTTNRIGNPNKVCLWNVWEYKEICENKPEINYYGVLTENKYIIIWFTVYNLFGKSIEKYTLIYIL